MRTIETTARVSEDGTLTLHAPSDVAPGEHNVVVVIDERLASGVVDKHRPSEGVRQLTPNGPARLGLEGWRVHDVGPWPDELSLRREDMYDDWGR